jgi:uncharacterized protein
MNISERHLHPYWPGWLSGLILAILIFAYYWVTGRMLASSGRITRVVDRLRHGKQDEELPSSLEELTVALRLATVDAFGATAARAGMVEPRRPGWRPRRVITWGAHLVFLVGLSLGGRLANPDASLAWTLGPGVWEVFVSKVSLPFLLLIAGVLVGFGTRMAGGCTIGHGLCGMSRGQAGSWASGLSFFAAGVALWFVVAGTQ